MRLEVRYRTLLTYSALAVESHNELRACPADTERQRLIEYRLRVQPPAEVLSYTDRWGTRVDAFGVRLPHIALEVLAEATVETTAPPQIGDGVDARRDALAEPAFVDAHFEYLQPSPHADWGEGVSGLAADIAATATDRVADLVQAIHERVHDELRYEPGSTEIGLPVEDVLRGGVGVCQDYAHLAVAICRSMGIPARYVSGYFFTASDREADEPMTGTVRVATHAWFEAAVPGWGWLALDPTSGVAITERHVKIAHGRDYDDVMPFRGVFNGPSESVVEAIVEIQRASEQPMDAATRFRTESETAVRLLHAEAAGQQQ